MLTKPIHGWSDFQLEGTSSYALSYLDDIAFDWVEQAIHGLETLLPFCVKGLLEPGRFLCLVSYWNCYVICEDEDEGPQDEDSISSEHSNTSMLEFCKMLYEDVKNNLGEWAAFADYLGDDFEEKKKILESRLSRLNELILEKEINFSKGHCIL